MATKRLPRPTQAITAQICKALKAGVPFETAARFVLGSKWADAVQWMMIAEKQHPTVVVVTKAHRHFHDEVIRAEAFAETRNAAVLQKSDNPRFALEWLKRRQPQRWATAQEQQAPPLPMSRAQSDALVDQILKARRIPPDPRLSLPVVDEQRLLDSAPPAVAHEARSTLAEIDEIKRRNAEPWIDPRDRRRDESAPTPLAPEPAKTGELLEPVRVVADYNGEGPLDVLVPVEPIDRPADPH